jgi:hypothetical protein
MSQRGEKPGDSSDVLLLSYENHLHLTSSFLQFVRFVVQSLPLCAFAPLREAFFLVDLMGSEELVAVVGLGAGDREERLEVGDGGVGVEGPHSSVGEEDVDAVGE